MRALDGHHAWAGVSVDQRAGDCQSLADPENRLTQRIKSGRPDEDAVAELYWVALTRPPTDEAQAQVNHVHEAKDRRKGLEDVAWAAVECEGVRLTPVNVARLSCRNTNTHPPAAVFTPPGIRGSLLRVGAGLLGLTMPKILRGRENSGVDITGQGGSRHIARAKSVIFLISLAAPVISTCST
jgi:hypothetical protein